MSDIEHFIQQQKARDLVCATCLHLNAGDWTAFLMLCERTRFSYAITNFSPEIKKAQCWMKQDYNGLAKLLDLLPKHNSDRATLTRHVTPYQVRPSTEEGVFDVLSQVSIYRTEWDAENSHLDSGATRLYVVGKYLDRVVFDGNRALLAGRVIDLDTRQVGIGSHHIL